MRPNSGEYMLTKSTPSPLLIFGPPILFHSAKHVVLKDICALAQRDTMSIMSFCVSIEHTAN